MSRSQIEVEQDGDVRVVAINNPDRRNSLDLGARTRLSEEIERAHEDHATRAIILTGRGGMFCAGGDVPSMKQAVEGNGGPRTEALHRLVRAIALGSTPVIAAVEGAAYGIGLSITALCDQVVAARDSRFCTAFTRLGLPGDGGVMWALPRRVGMSRARTMLMLGPVIEGLEAHEIGLVDHLVEPGAVLTEAVELAQRIADGPPLALETIKREMWSRSGSLDEFLERERTYQHELFSTDDFAEGVAAFLAGREPRFHGS